MNRIIWSVNYTFIIYQHFFSSYNLEIKRVFRVGYVSLIFYLNNSQYYIITILNNLNKKQTFNKLQTWERFLQTVSVTREN